VVDDLEWDVKVYFAVNAAVHEAGCAAWSLKRYYDGWRPLSAIRYLGSLGQSSDPKAASYNTNGLPLIPGLIELVTPTTAATGGRHAGLTPGVIALLSWPGQPATPATTYQGVRWTPADNWITYQKTNFVTPAFPGYVSGHSAFSRSAAEVLTAITGSPYFPGGIGSYDAPANAKLVNEMGPSQTIQLQWATYFDAADLAGQSRIYGGIHPPVDNFAGRQVGSFAGKGVWEVARKYFDGSITSSPSLLSISKRAAGTDIRYQTLRGLYYKLQSSPSVSQAFTDEPGGFILAVDSSSLLSVPNPTGPAKFYRAVSSPTP
jgi:membrane-associated phospholipid phosphatase